MIKYHLSIARTLGFKNLGSHSNCIEQDMQKNFFLKKMVYDLILNMKFTICGVLLFLASLIYFTLCFKKGGFCKDYNPVSSSVVSFINTISIWKFSSFTELLIETCNSITTPAKNTDLSCSNQVPWDHWLDSQPCSCCIKWYRK